MARDFLSFLYNTIPGRCLLKVLADPGLSAACGKFMDSRASRVLIRDFVKRNNIDMSDFKKKSFSSFNDFFTRELKPGKRPVEGEPKFFPSPCDGLLSAYEIRDNVVLDVKQSEYTVSSLLRDPELARSFDGGLCLVFRLCVNHYHRYIFPDNGRITAFRRIKGVLHTVRPVALLSRPVFTENSREYTVTETENFGQIVQMEVGAMLVGKIDNYRKGGLVERGEEKGKFLYGGSTVIVLLEKGTYRFDSKFASAFLGNEVPVKMGEKVLEIV